MANRKLQQRVRELEGLVAANKKKEAALDTVTNLTIQLKRAMEQAIEATAEAQRCQEELDKATAEAHAGRVAVVQTCGCDAPQRRVQVRTATPADATRLADRIFSQLFALTLNVFKEKGD